MRKSVKIQSVENVTNNYIKVEDIAKCDNKHILSYEEIIKVVLTESYDFIQNYDGGRQGVERANDTMTAYVSLTNMSDGRKLSNLRSMIYHTKDGKFRELKRREYIDQKMEWNILSRLNKVIAKKFNYNVY